MAQSKMAADITQHDFDIYEPCCPESHIKPDSDCSGGRYMWALRNMDAFLAANKSDRIPVQNHYAAMDHEAIIKFLQHFGAGWRTVPPARLCVIVPRGTIPMDVTAVEQRELKRQAKDMVDKTNASPCILMARIGVAMQAKRDNTTVPDKVTRMLSDITVDEFLPIAWLLKQFSEMHCMGEPLTTLKAVLSASIRTGFNCPPNTKTEDVKLPTVPEIWNEVIAIYNTAVIDFVSMQRYVSVADETKMRVAVDEALAARKRMAEVISATSNDVSTKQAKEAVAAAAAAQPAAAPQPQPW